MSDNLSYDLDDNIDRNYCDIVMNSFGEEPVFIIDDSDVIKPLGEKFENLGILRAGRWINLILVYGLSETSMMLASNIAIICKYNYKRIKILKR